MQHSLKPAPRAARTQVIAAKLLGQLDVTMDETPAAFDVGFRGE
jgi:hypothetical protein